MRKRRSKSSGFALLGIVIVLMLMSVAVAIVQEEVAGSLRNASIAKESEMVKGAVEAGLDQALDQVLTQDAVVLVEQDFDIFNAPTPESAGKDFLTAFNYPNVAAGNSNLVPGAYRVRMGLRPGQRTRPPAGEDVRNSFGQIVELQVSVRQQIAGRPAVEERASVGVLIPRVLPN